MAERGMVFSLLLQSQYGNGNSATKKNCSNLENEDAVKIQESVASGSILSTSVPRFVAGYEDGSISCFDLRTFRYVAIAAPNLPGLQFDIFFFTWIYIGAS